MNKSQFMDQYIVSGMAAWAMLKNDEYCQMGRHQDLRGFLALEREAKNVSI